MLPSHTGWPLKYTLMLSGSMSASAIPTAARTRPQFGSEPNIAHLNRLSRPIVRAALSACSSVVVPSTVMDTRLVTPSASDCSWRARSRLMSSTASARSSAEGVTPDAPEAMITTESLVEVVPSMSRVSKVTALAARSARSSTSGVTNASVVIHVSIVAKDGAIMPTPLAMPPTVQPSRTTTASFATVSVVMIAVAAAVPSSPSDVLI